MRTPYFIAEVSSNHHRDFERCLHFIDTAAAMGCDAVKFQLFRVDRLFAPEILQKSAKHREREAWELPPEWSPRLAAHCRARHIAYSCTPFDLEAVQLLSDHVAFLKIASYELLWTDLLKACAKTKRPVVLSTGMADLAEVCAAVDTMRTAGCQDLTLLHCSSAYPTPARECNLAAIETLRHHTGCPVGWSDHSRQPAVLQRAIHRWAAAAIEFHLDLEGAGDEFAAGHCWLPDEMERVITESRTAFEADGASTKAPNPSEQPDRLWRADPSDGLRPLRSVRQAFQG